MRYKKEWRVVARKFRKTDGCFAAAKNRPLCLGRPSRTLITI